MNNLSSYPIAILVTVLTYMLGILIYRKSGSPFLNPIIVALLLITLVVHFTPLTWDLYITGSRPILHLLPLTIIVLALPLYQQLPLLKKHHKAILAGAAAGVATSATSLFFLCRLMGIDLEILRSIIPKSITTPLGLTLSRSLDGLEGITVIAIVATGIMGIVFYLPVFKLFKITHPIAKGVALGTASHAVGTSKAIELGEVEGAMSSLSILVSGVITILSTPLLLLLISLY